MDKLLAASAVLAAEFPHLTDDRWQFLAEGPSISYLLQMTRAGAGALRVYDLQSADEPGPTGLSQAQVRGDSRRHGSR